MVRPASKHAHSWARASMVTLVLACGCGDDEPAGSGGAGGGNGSSGTGASGGEPGAGGDGGSGAAGATGGQGGRGGEVDPIAGIGAVELVAEGFEFTEGPAWFAGPGELLFTDIPASRIHRLVPPADVSVAYEPSNAANGLGVDTGGLLVACEHETRRVTRRLANDSIEVLADEWQAQSLNSPNDNIVKSDGTVYFTDPPYGISPAEQELAFQGVFRIAPDGSLSLVDDTMNRPNGVALSPDESVLYVADSEDALVRSWPVAGDGSTGEGAKLMDLGGGGDGMAVDDDGNLYVTTGNGIEVYRPDGSAWGTIEVPEVPANCTFGGADRRTLYITARTSLYRVETNVPGKP